MMTALNKKPWPVLCSTLNTYMLTLKARGLKEEIDAVRLRTQGLQKKKKETSAGFKDLAEVKCF